MTRATIRANTHGNESHKPVLIFIAQKQHKPTGSLWHPMYDCLLSLSVFQCVSEVRDPPSCSQDDILFPGQAEAQRGSELTLWKLGAQRRTGRASRKPTAPSRAIKLSSSTILILVGFSVLPTLTLLSCEFTPGGQEIDTQGRLGRMIPMGRMEENTPGETTELSSTQASPLNQVWPLSTTTGMASPVSLKPGGNRNTEASC